ncbi:response regulator [Citrobacter portucalensis]|uniref:response regulator n=1 Tax=Citrobacter portucalensis TaxID=1639133 RepID=UPI00226B2C17|nr:response regulator [Citrobacter portucalensis]MCX8992111.1 response regulator [Citrobacter portucalensis]
MIKVLVVEDDPMVAELNKGFLRMIDGFVLTGTINNGIDALTFIEKNEIELLLLDVFMPGLDGLNLLKEVRIRFPNVDVIMVTAARSGDDIQAALRLGAIDYVIKPFIFERFQSALINYRERARLLADEAELSQAVIDGRIFAKEIRIHKVPKGIEQETLARIREIVRQQLKPFDVQTLVPVVKLSRISLKKYLDYMVETGDLYSELAYRRQGRPVTLYRFVR